MVTIRKRQEVCLPQECPECHGRTCPTCTGQYKFITRTDCIRVGNRFQCSSRSDLVGRGFATCHCNGRTIFLGINEEFSPPPLPLPPIGPNPPLPPPPVCPDPPPDLPVVDLGTFWVINQSDISDPDVQTAIGFVQNQIDNDFQNPWGLRCTLTLTDVPEPAPAFNVFILNDSDLAGASGYHTGGHVAKVFKNDSSNWVRTFSHEVLEMLADPDINNYSDVVTLFGKTGPILIEVCDPTSLCYDGTYDGPANPLSPLSMSDFVFPSWYVAGSNCPWDFLGKAPGPFTFVGPTGFAQMNVGGTWYNLNNSGATIAADPELSFGASGIIIAPIGIGSHYKP